MSFKEKPDSDFLMADVLSLSTAVSTSAPESRSDEQGLAGILKKVEDESPPAGTRSRSSHSTGPEFAALSGPQIPGPKRSTAEQEILESLARESESWSLADLELLHEIRWKSKIPARATCPDCGRSVFVEFGFLSTHREDPPSSVICSASGTWAGLPA